MPEPEVIPDEAEHPGPPIHRPEPSGPKRNNPLNTVQPTAMMERIDGYGNLFKTVVARSIQNSSSPVVLSYMNPTVVGNGSFGVVCKATLVETGELVAIKTVLLDSRYTNREDGVMAGLNHCNVVKLKYIFHSYGEINRVFMNLVLEFVPFNLNMVIKQYSMNRKKFPLDLVKLYMYQLFRALAYIHKLGLCHRDLKPANMLIHAYNGVFKVCDFGCAKYLTQEQLNVSYIGTRWYRAPELFMGARNYDNSIDIWSAGCVMAELIVGRPVFAGRNEVEHLVDIIRVLGSPTRKQIFDMNPNYTQSAGNRFKPVPWRIVLGKDKAEDAINLVSRLLVYSPGDRISPLQACAHEFFDALREPYVSLTNDRALPPLFNFTNFELEDQPELMVKLVPAHYNASLA